MTAQLETALVGSLLADPDKLISASEIVKPTDFTDHRACLAYSTIMETWQSKSPVSLVTIAAKIPALSVFLAQASGQSFPPSVPHFSQEIAEAARLRRIKAGIEAAMQEKSADEILADIMGVYRHEMKSGKKSPAIGDIMKRVEGVVATNRKVGKVGFATGLQTLESNYIRLAPGHIWTIGGYTSVGKTATMVQMVCNLLSGGENPAILIISTEMTEEQIVARIVSNFSGIPSFRILAGNYHDAEEQDRADSIKRHLMQAKLSIYDDIYRLDEIETAFHKADLQGGVNVGVIDYVQNCRWPDAKSQYQEQSEMAKRFQALAKDVRATLVCLSQVSNDVGRGNTDQLELKGAGEWAAVSDVGIMLKRHKTEKHRLLMEVKKNRHGALCETELEYVNCYTSLKEKTGV
jgi:replicative DNA helicase